MPTLPVSRRLVVSGLAAAFLPASALWAEDQWPSRPITMIVPFAAGGSTDVIARVVAEGLRQELGQPVLVDNRGGAGGTIGTAAIVKAQPDGYTIGMGTASTLAINPAAYKTLGYDVLVNLIPVSNIAAVPNIMSINADVKAADMKAFIALAKAEPGRLSYASAGIGSVSHLMGEQFKLGSGTDLVHVPYRGIGPALNDAVAGQVQVLFDNLPSTLPMVQAGKLRALAVSGPDRVPALPDVPTFAEVGLDDVNWMAFFGLVVPEKTPPAIVAKLNAATVKALAREEVRSRLIAQQAVLIGNAPQEFAAEIRRDLDRMKRAVTAAKIELN
ncbi:Bug family tripartite tricarboxylate transporter substrate binding protein [Rhodoplanes roseus]|uniref:ABC transporter substrate-binding protein n=1 Tax=Rhodoplanes roseus TaxID=29409 RepID=A0A327KKE8_9BRAD|nr:tripartite tricarboxylate transporter substrate-binding protein [Rhodoplanes roseus]RAI38566.1 ABC transporter substrate-binding protein [Rhodoplanes roseus]